jgi:isoleucyl-tRNA synthetase
MEPFDRLALAALDALTKDVVEHYRAFRLHDAYLALQRFDTEDLSSFYVDVLKDRLYSSAANDPRRRSAQSALLEILRTFAVLLAPVLSFTAEEAWQHLAPGLRGSAESVFDIAFPQVGHVDAHALAQWQLVRELRTQVAASEGLRDFQLAARVAVDAAMVEPLRALGDGLREALVVSEVLGIDVAPGGAASVAVEPAHGEKCARCWKYLPLGGDPEFAEVCTPCARIVRATNC